MKRLLALLMAALLILALCACGETEPKVTVQTEAPKATATPKPAATAKPTATPKPTKAPAPTETPALVALEPADPEQTGETDRSAPAADPEPTPNERDYVLNSNTLKFHYPTCSSVKDIKEGNRKDVHATRDSIIAQGYAPCGKCKP